jgi:hypothetical protein
MANVDGIFRTDCCGSLCTVSVPYNHNFIISCLSENATFQDFELP